jgi:hypothetical protein
MDILTLLALSGSQKPSLSRVSRTFRELIINGKWLPPWEGWRPGPGLPWPIWRNSACGTGGWWAPSPYRSPIFFLHLEPSHSRGSTEHHLDLLGHLGFKVYNELFQAQLSVPLSLLLEDLEIVVQESSEKGWSQLLDRNYLRCLT